MIIRPITADELADWGRAVNTGFLRAHPENDLAFREEHFEPGRSLGAFDGDRIVGTFRSMRRDITVPGGAVLRTDAVTNVTVTSTHRRRGLLTRMMRADLDAAVGRGEALAILDAAEYGIYGRFGFGPCTGLTAYTIDVRRSGGLRPDLPPSAGSVELLSMAEVRKYGPELHERFRRGQVGAIDRPSTVWRLITGELRHPAHPGWQEPTAVLHRAPDGTPDGLALYSVDDVWRHGDSYDTLTVRDVLATGATAAVELWRHLFSVDWIATVKVDNVAPDDPLPLLLRNPRACVPHEDSTADWIWLRVLDVPAALGARRYDAPGRLVLDVADRMGYAEGRYALEVDQDGTGSVSATADPADLSLDVSALGTRYLGAQTAHRLAAAGLVREERPGAAARADRMLRTDTRPWCPDGF
jgi:predicted acetyltransferase